MTVRTVRLTEKESRMLHSIERMIAWWQSHADPLRYEAVVSQLEDLRNDLLEREED